MNDEKNRHLPYKDDEYMVLENEFEQIQSCIGMYISYKGEKGAIHISKEIFNNALDECTNEESPGNKIDVFIDEEEKKFIYNDNGRGIPFDQMVKVCTSKHSGTKFGRKFNKYSTGQNGVGLTVTVALSIYFSMTSYRGLESKTIEFKNCALTEHPIKKEKKERYGTIVTFIPNEEYLGAININADDIEAWIRRISYTIPEGIKIDFSAKKRDGVSYTHHYKTQPLSESVKFLSPDLEFPPLSFDISNEDMDLRMSFSYDKTTDNQQIESYCNYVHTIEHGEHVNACERAIYEFFTYTAKQDTKAKYEVTFDDCKKGLVLVVDCKHKDPEFGGQVKERVENKDIFKVGKPEMRRELQKYFSSNNLMLNKILTYLRQIARIRMEGNKIKNVGPKKSTFLDDAEMGSIFLNISDRNNRDYSELILTEGDSAGDALDGVRNRRYQAIFKLGGVIANTFELNTADAMKKKGIKYLIEVMGTGIGKTADINKLRWNKIIIGTDADIDGDNITSSTSAFFFKHMPFIIEAGKLYKLVPPLYLLDKKSLKKFGLPVDKDYVFDKSEYFDIIFELISKRVNLLIKDPNTNSYKNMKKSEIRAFLYHNKDYMYELDKLCKRTYCKPIVLEKVCSTLIHKTNKLQYIEDMNDLFPELSYDDDTKVISGSLNREITSLIVDELFIKSARPLMDIIDSNIDLMVVSKRVDEPEEAFQEMTIGEFLSNVLSTYDIATSQRFKGLGEMGNDLRFKTVLNPNLRKIVQLKMSDFERTQEILSLLHGKGEKMAAARRDLLDNTKITYDDIDN